MGHLVTSLVPAGWGNFQGEATIALWSPAGFPVVRSALDVAADSQQSSLGGKMALQEIHLEPGVGLSRVVARVR